MNKREDVHRPAEIEPMDYEFIAIQHYPRDGELIDFHELKANREYLRDHMKSTGGRFSTHNHGGTCHVCGAWAIDMAIYYHAKTNTYIKTGLDCAEKMFNGDARLFRNWRTARKEAAERKAGLGKAEHVLKENGLEAAWNMFNGFRQDETDTVEYDSTIVDMIWKLVRYGSLSEKQLNYMRILIDRQARRAEIKAERQADWEAAENAPEGKQTITGSILTVRVQESIYGMTYKMLVRDDRGFKVWSTLPSSIEDGRELKDYRDTRITFNATLTISDNDPKFAFAKRPTQAKVLE